MTVTLVYLDRDEVVAEMRAEKEERENESEISKLVRQINQAREELRITEANLAVIEQSLSGKSKG